MPRAATISAALATLLLLGPATQARGAPHNYMGVNWDSSIVSAPDAIRDAQFPRMASAGVETVRTAFIWANAQPEEFEPVDVTATDAFMAQAAARRLEV